MKKYMLSAIVALAGLAMTTSCEDMLDKGNENVLYGEDNHLVTPSDTVNSYAGILNQLQKIAVRTNLLGELRGDLTVVNENADADIKEISNFNVSSDNEYNDPRDYYAIINNCNYYLANANDSLKNNQNQYIFKHEKDAVRAIRAWVYLQLGQIYGDNIPLVLEPILSELQADLSRYPKTNIQGICDEFINDLLQVNTDSKAYQYPQHGTYDQTTAPPSLCVLPIDLVLGDLYLWRAAVTGNQNDARLAAKAYYRFIYWNTGYKPYSNVARNRSISWMEESIREAKYTGYSTGYGSCFNTTSVGGEVLSIIPMDSASADGYYNRLRQFYSYDLSSSTMGLSEACISPSQVCWDYSDSQSYCAYTSQGILYADPSAFTEMQVARHRIGDLRMMANYDEATVNYNSQRYELQVIDKIDRNICLYRIGQVWLRLAEALNMAGFPKFALAILVTGVDNGVLENEVLSQCSSTEDSLFVKGFDFPATSTQFAASVTYDGNGNRLQRTPSTDIRNIGLHSRGSGDTPFNEYYYDYAIDVPADSTGYPIEPVYPGDDVTGFIQPTPVEAGASSAQRKAYNDSLTAYNAQVAEYMTLRRNEYKQACKEWYAYKGVPQVKARQIAVVDSLIDVEQALELCFEGYRFGDLMRAAYWRSDNNYLAKRVARRDPALLGRLSDRRNWFINWKGQIGM